MGGFLAVVLRSRTNGAQLPLTWSVARLWTPCQPGKRSSCVTVWAKHRRALGRWLRTPREIPDCARISRPARARRGIASRLSSWEERVTLRERDGWSARGGSARGVERARGGSAPRAREGGEGAPRARGSRHPTPPPTPDFLPIRPSTGGWHLGDTPDATMRSCATTPTAVKIWGVPSWPSLCHGRRCAR